MVQQDRRQERTMVDKVFFTRILSIIKIMVPRVVCKEVCVCETIPKCVLVCDCTCVWV